MILLNHNKVADLKILTEIGTQTDGQKIKF